MELVEGHLVNVANQLIGKLKIGLLLIKEGNCTPQDFVKTLDEGGHLLRIDSEVHTWRAGTLGEIVAAAKALDDRSQKSVFKLAFQDVFPDKRTFFGNTDSALESLRDIAYRVVITAIYEVLMTEWYVRNVEKGNVKPTSTTFVPTESLKTFVICIRLAHTS